ncbi:MAG: hypothetical protein AB7F65_06440 [Dehalococcoidia bacterium]
MIAAAVLQALNDRLDAARADLLAALADVTERDFATDLGGVTVVQLLARVAGEERTAAARAAGGDYTPRPVEKPMPPQVVHALAGARYRTRRYLESPEADEATGRALVEAAERREADAAARIAARPPLPPLPEAPSTPEIPMIPPEQARRA